MANNPSAPISRRNLLGLCLGMALWHTCIGPAHAIGNFTPSEWELRLLPPYCIPRAMPWGDDRDHPIAGKWFAVFGDEYRHLHHYCSALLDIWKASRPGESHPEFLLNKAKGDLDYVARRIPEDYLLWPEMHLQYAKIYRGLGRIPQAIASARKAVVAKPGYTLAVALLADLLVEAGRPEEARATLEAGLQNKPTSKMLLRRHECLLGTRKAQECPPRYEALTSDGPR